MSVYDSISVGDLFEFIRPLGTGAAGTVWSVSSETDPTAHSDGEPDRACELLSDVYSRGDLETYSRATNGLAPLWARCGCRDCKEQLLALIAPPLLGAYHCAAECTASGSSCGGGGESARPTVAVKFVPKDVMHERHYTNATADGCAGPSTYVGGEGHCAGDMNVGPVAAPHLSRNAHALRDAAPVSASPSPQQQGRRHGRQHSVASSSSLSNNTSPSLSPSYGSSAALGIGIGIGSSATPSPSLSPSPPRRPFFLRETKKAVRSRTEYEVAKSLMALAAEIEAFSPSEASGGGVCKCASAACSRRRARSRLGSAGAASESASPSSEGRQRARSALVRAHNGTAISSPTTRLDHGAVRSRAASDSVATLHHHSHVNAIGSEVSSSPQDAQLSPKQTIPAAPRPGMYLQYPRYLPRYHSVVHAQQHVCYTMHHYERGSLREALQQRTAALAAAEKEASAAMRARAATHAAKESYGDQLAASPHFMSDAHSPTRSLRTELSTGAYEPLNDHVHAHADTARAPFTPLAQSATGRKKKRRKQGSRSGSGDALGSDDEDGDFYESEGSSDSSGENRCDAGSASDPVGSGAATGASSSPSPSSFAGSGIGGRVRSSEGTGDVSESLVQSFALRRYSSIDGGSGSGCVFGDGDEALGSPTSRPHSPHMQRHRSGGASSLSGRAASGSPSNESRPESPNHIGCDSPHCRHRPATFGVSSPVHPHGAQRQGPLPPIAPRLDDEDVLKHTAAQILVALQFLHHHNIQYRDLKTENILVDARGYVALGDFDCCRAEGLEGCWGPAAGVGGGTSAGGNPFGSAGKWAKGRLYDSSRGLRDLDGTARAPFTTSSDSAIPQHKRSTSLVGTVDYLCPEVISDAPVGPAIDSWGFGVLLFELATGASPFRPNNASASSNSTNRRVDKKGSSGAASPLAAPAASSPSSPHHQKLLEALPVDKDKAVVRAVADHAHAHGFTIKDAEIYRRDCKNAAKQQQEQNSKQMAAGAGGGVLSNARVVAPLFSASSYAAFVQQQLVLLASATVGTAAAMDNRSSSPKPSIAAASDPPSPSSGFFRSLVSSIFGPSPAGEKRAADGTDGKNKRGTIRLPNGSVFNVCPSSLAPVPYEALAAAEVGSSNGKGNSNGSTVNIARLLPQQRYGTEPMTVGKRDTAPCACNGGGTTPSNGSASNVDWRACESADATAKRARAADRIIADARRYRMSPALLDLLRGLLNPHPNKRLSLEQCRRHHWWFYTADGCGAPSATLGGAEGAETEGRLGLEGGMDDAASRRKRSVFYNMYRFPEAPLRRFLDAERPYLAPDGAVTPISQQPHTHGGPFASSSGTGGAALSATARALAAEKAITPQQASMRGLLEMEKLTQLGGGYADPDDAGGGVGDNMPVVNTSFAATERTLAFVFGVEMAAVLSQPARTDEGWVEHEPSGRADEMPRRAADPKVGVPYVMCHQLLDEIESAL